MSVINKFASGYPTVKNRLEFLEYKNQCEEKEINQVENQESIVKPFKNKCVDENCFGHPEEYTCDPCLSNMGLSEDPVSHYAFEAVHESIQTCSDYTV
jgi:hypothetical protein|tara:strand:- start:118 stop:411 length:294 start_codon:yes stop_codon:yes gene_type:complete